MTATVTAAAPAMMARLRGRAAASSRVASRSDPRPQPARHSAQARCGASAACAAGRRRAGPRQYRRRNGSWNILGFCDLWREVTHHQSALREGGWYPEKWCPSPYA